jgi:hypothetical protein
LILILYWDYFIKFDQYGILPELNIDHRQTDLHTSLTPDRDYAQCRSEMEFKKRGINAQLSYSAELILINLVSSKI